MLALLGPNSGGKTTLLRTLLGLLPPRKVDGRSLGLHSARARLIAYVPQSHAPSFAFTVEAMVMMGRQLEALRGAAIETLVDRTSGAAAFLPR